MSATEPSHRVTHAYRSLRWSRHSARAPRYLLIATTIIFAVLGVRSAFLIPRAVTAPPAPRPGADAPSQDFALQFARAYLTYDAARPGARETALAPYIGSALDPGAGLQPLRGSQHVRWLEVASDQPALAGGRAITVAAAVSTQRLPLYLTITVEHRRGDPLHLVGYPALVGSPELEPPAPPPAREAVDDPLLSQVVDRVLRNYLSLAGPDLEADLAADARVTLPTRRLHLDEVRELLWLGDPGSNAVLATVTASDAEGAAYTLTYELGIERRERPYIDFIEVVPTAT